MTVRNIKLGGRPLTKIRLEAEKQKRYESQLSLKTAHMMRLEQIHQETIQMLLADGSGRVVAKRLKVTESCVSKWRKKFGLSDMPDGRRK